MIRCMRLVCSTSKSRTVSPALVDDPECEPLSAAAAQLGILDLDPQAVLGDREATHGMRRIAGVGGIAAVRLARLVLVGARRGVLLGLGIVTIGLHGCGGRGVVTVRADRGAGQRAPAEQQGENAAERGELDSRVHVITSWPPLGQRGIA